MRGTRKERGKQRDKKKKKVREKKNVQPRSDLSIDGKRDGPRDKGQKYKDRHAKANGTEDTKG